MMEFINGRPKNKPQMIRGKKKIRKTSQVVFNGIHYTDVTNVFAYSAEWQSDKEYMDVMSAKQW